MYAFVRLALLALCALGVPRIVCAEPPSRGLIFFVHGVGGPGSYLQASQHFHALGYETCLSNIPNAKEHTPDAVVLKVIEHFDICYANYPTPQERTIVMGTSLGGYAAARLAGVRSNMVGKLVLHAPANYPDGTGILSSVIGDDRVAYMKLKAWRETPLRCGGREHNAAIEGVCTFRMSGGKVLVIGGSLDERITPTAQAVYASAAGVESVILPGIGHGSAEDPQVIGVITKWLEMHTQPKVAATK